MTSSDRQIELKKWKFIMDQQDYGEMAGWQLPQHDHSCWTEVESYCPWDAYEEAMKNYEGVGWYFTTFTASEDASLCRSIHFDGIGGTAKVFLNGKYAGETDCRYLPFDVDGTELLRPGEENTVVVRVDNCFRGVDHLTGGKKVEWVLYGGLTHHVYAVESSPCHVDNIRIRALASGETIVTAVVENRTAADFDGEFTICQAELLPDKISAAVHCGAGKRATVSLSANVTPELWSPEHPKLYIFKGNLICVGKAVHEVSVRTGYRTIERRGTELYLNGEKLILKGANRYDEYAPYGCCAPADKIRDDLLEMKNCGMNLVRTHYPQDPVHYEIADEIGLMYMIEVPLNWWNPDPELKLDDFPDLQREAVDVLDRTFLYYSNHPCWTIWSVGNECEHKRPAALSMFRMLAARMRDLTPDRLITNVTCRILESSEELDYCDFISLNYYFGMTEDCADGYPEGLKVMREWIDIAHRLYPEYPLVVTEFGCDSVCGMHGNGREGRFTEELAATYLRMACEVITAEPHMRGLVLWCWADYHHRVTFIQTKAIGMHIHAPYGPYGIVSIYRRKKQAPMEAIREIYRNFNP